MRFSFPPDPTSYRENKLVHSHMIPYRLSMGSLQDRLQVLTCYDRMRFFSEIRDQIMTQWLREAYRER